MNTQWVLITSLMLLFTLVLLWRGLVDGIIKRRIVGSRRTLEGDDALRFGIMFVVLAVVFGFGGIGAIVVAAIHGRLH